MTNFRQILVALAVIQWAEEVKCTPLLQGIKISRDFNIDFKPFEFKPFSYIREKWGPFGAFGKKYAISKRDLDSVLITPPPQYSSLGPAYSRPAPVVEATPDSPPPPVNISPIPVFSSTPPTEISNDIFQDASPVAPVKPIIGSDFNLNRPTGLYTQLSKIQPFTPVMNPTPIYDETPLRVNLLVPPVTQPEVNTPVAQPTPETPFRVGIARLFGQFILNLFSRIINSARSSFGQLPSRVEPVNV